MEIMQITHSCMARHWLKDLRSGKFSSQSALARAADIMPARFSRIEAGYCDMRDDEAKSLALALKVTVEEVLTGKPATVTNVKPAIVDIPPAAPAKLISVATPVVPTKLADAVVIGDNLADPKNFTLLPPVELFPRVQAGDAGARALLRQALVMAEKVLHTSRVRPAVWVAWRDFGRNGPIALREQSVVQTAPPSPPPKSAPIGLITPQPSLTPATATPKLPDAAASGRMRSNKNALGHFLDIAREILPADLFTTLESKAKLAKGKQPEVGFMRHFKLAAQVVLTPGDFNRIDSEAALRAEQGRLVAAGA